MDQPETHDQKMSRVARELDAAIRRLAEGRWGSVRLADRDEGRRHAWRFRRGPKSGARFLRVTHRAMDQGENPVPLLMEQLAEGRWLDRLNGGADGSLVLDAGGRLELRPRR